MAAAATVDRRRYPDARLPDVLVDGLGGRCKSNARTSAGKSAEFIFEVVATLIKVRFYGMSALPPDSVAKVVSQKASKILRAAGAVFV